MGCKLNFYDSEVLAQELKARGFERVDSHHSADLNILNSCTVTNNSDSEARNLIRRFRRQNPNCFVVVTGCYASADPGKVRAMEEVDFVSTNAGKYDVEPMLAAFHGAGAISQQDHDIMEKRPAEFRLLERFSCKTRAFVKIQDGCSLRCSYCIIPMVRGNNRSVAAADVLAQMRLLADGGVEEAVLTGIHLGTWGRDLRPRAQLLDLLNALEASDLTLWIRISSLDSPEIPDELIRHLQTSRLIVPHLHIPLQSGSDATLRRMRRIYTSAQYANRVAALRQALPHACLGADVIVGFPGESDEEFAETEAFLHRSPLDYLHVFPYSNRSGTAAAAFADQVNGRVIRNRSRALRELSDHLRQKHRERHAGTLRPAILLPAHGPSGPLQALTDNYIECSCVADSNLIGRRVLLRLPLADEEAQLVGLLGSGAGP
jgi:threonylcarbamoyladenosine tRNA methylthiotransferase MtaB